ncbi:MAG: acyl-CoA dehydrogenase family protein [Acidimicrobiia bacterium]
MKVDLGPEAESFRQELRAYLAAHHPGRAPHDGLERIEFQRQWARTLAADGVAAPGWPREYGGMGLGPAEQFVYHQEAARARVPSHPSPPSFICGPTLIEHGTDEQRERFLARMVRGDDLWCQGFSEPGAGSDLSVLETIAVRDGDEYVVNGSKVWTSHASRTDWMFALVRTGGPGRDGISYLLIPMRSPGLEVRPLRDMAGDEFFAQVYFTDVRVPVANRVGEENGGWPIMRTTLGHERSTAFVANAIRYRDIVEQLRTVARDAGVTGDPCLRQRLAAIEIDARILEISSLRMLQSILREGSPGPAASLNRLFHGTFEQRLHEVAVAVLGAEGMLAPTDPHSVQRGRWTWGMLRTRASTIGAGTAEIQRNTIGERILGLPVDRAETGATPR